VKGRILAAVDGSEYALRALDVAADLAASLNGELIACHVVDLSRAAVLSGGEAQLVPGCLEELQDESRRILAQALARVGGRVAASARSVKGTPVEAIGRLAQELRPDFIVIGSHGRTGLARALVGSVAEGVVRAAPVPVVVVPRPHGAKDFLQSA